MYYLGYDELEINAALYEPPEPIVKAEKWDDENIAKTITPTSVELMDLLKIMNYPDF